MECYHCTFLLFTTAQIGHGCTLKLSYSELELGLLYFADRREFNSKIAIVKNKQENKAEIKECSHAVFP